MKLKRLTAWVFCGAFGAVLGYFAAQSRPETEVAAVPVSVPQPSIADPSTLQIEACGDIQLDWRRALAPCLLVQAGGKRLVFGAPLEADWTGIGALDAVFLFDGRPVTSGGLLGLRYETWFEGRPGPQLLISGELSLDTLRALDDALLVPDALSQVEYPLRLDTRRAGFAVKPIPATRQNVMVFDTGDLKVFANSGLTDAGDQILAYRLVYGEETLHLYSCDSRLQRFDDEPSAVILPFVDKSELSSLLRIATREKLEARQFEISRLGRACPSLRQAIDFAEQSGAGALIFPDTQMKIDAFPGAMDIDVRGAAVTSLGD
ncbi:MAG: hypothetical protein CMK07_01515 [Ponticaulis sp.]|nr:hypothetical protein [Ponticaulis sp.]